MSKKLESLYDKIPKVKCKGLCHQSCTIVPASKIEIKRARSRMGGKNPFNPTLHLKTIREAGIIPSCSALKNKRCSIYNVRPAICRLYGVAENLECHFGCVPEKIISQKDAHEIIKAIDAL